MIWWHTPVLLEGPRWCEHVAVAGMKPQGPMAFSDPINKGMLPQRNVGQASPSKGQGARTNTNEIV